MLRKNAKDYRVRRQPNTAAGRALHAVAAFFGAIARVVLRRKNAQAARESLNVGGVLDAFLRDGERIRDASAARADAAWDSPPTQTVVDEDGTEVAYHERGGRRSAELDSVPKHDGIGEDVLDALDVMLRTEGDTTIYMREYGDVLLAFGRFRNQVPGLKGNGFLHVLEERTSKDGLSTPEAVEVFLKAVEAAVRGKENKALRSSNRHAIELNGYRAIVADNGDFREFITGYKIFTDEEKKKRSGVETDAIRRSEDYNPAFYDRLRQEGAERLKERIAQLLAERQVPKSVEELEQELEDLDIAHYRLLNARKKAEENGASQEELDALQKDIDDNRAKYKQVAKAKKKLNQQRAKERKLYGDPNEERRDHISDLFTGARLAYDKPDLHFVGTGEGAQVYGWGHYSSASRGVAQDEYARRYVREYKKLLRRGKNRQGTPKIELGGGVYSDFDKFVDAINDISLHIIKTFSSEEDVKRNTSGDYIIGGRTIPQELLLFVAAQRLSVVNIVEIFNAWVQGLDFSRDYLEDRYYNFITSLPLFHTPYLSDETKFYVDELNNGPLKSKDAWKAFASKFFPDPRKEKHKGTLPAVMQQTWWTHRPEGDESHLLNWFEDISYENLQRVIQAAIDAGATDRDLFNFNASVRTGGDAYEWLGRFFQKKGMAKNEAKKAASEALYAHDIDGVKYPVGAFLNPSNQDGRKGWNYVAFSDDFLRVDHVYEYNPETDDFERKWHEAEGASGPRFTETPLGQELVAKAFDAIVGVDADLLLRPWSYNEKREPGKGLVTAGLGRDVDMEDPKDLAAEVSARIARFGTREGDPTLREIRARCGSKERFYEVMGSVFEAAIGLKMGVQDVITQREFSAMEKRMPLYAWVIRHNAQARATALGRKAYIMGRRFAERLHREALEAARAEARTKVREANAKARASEGKARNAERREETERHRRMRAEFSAAEADFIARWKLEEERAISRMRIDTIREAMKASAVEARVREARKRAVERERGVSFMYLKGTLGVDIRAELRALAGADNDPAAVAADLLRKIELGFDKWVREQRPELLENSGSYWQLLNEQGEKAYRETMGNVLKAVARELSYGKLRESILNAVDLFAHSRHETVHDAVEGKLARVIAVLRIAQNADVVALTKRRIKSALAEANKRLSSEASSARTRYMTSMRRLCKELLATFEDAVDAQGTDKAAEKRRKKLTELKHALEDELEKIDDGKPIEDLAKDETLTERQHKDAVS